MTTVADIALVAPDGTPKLLVEVKGRTPPSSNWAAQLRRNLLSHGHLPKPGWFLLVSPERLYLWSPSSDPRRAVAPEYEAEARSILEPFLQEGVHPRVLSGRSWELVVWAWLSDLLENPPPREEAPEILGQSGLLEALRGTRLQADYRA